MTRPTRILSFLLLFGTLGPMTALAQHAELQAYPAGLILTSGLDLGPVGLHAGYNLTRRQDFGKHDDERGGGFGAGATWWHPTPLQLAGLRLGLRLDVWQLAIDWEDGGRSGSTDITVVQPSLRAAWHVPATHVAVTVALGMEVNVQTRGEDVGEGPIGLIGLRWSLR